MSEPETSESWYSFKLIRVLLLLFFLFLVLTIIDLVAATSLGTNARKSFNTVQQQVAPPLPREKMQK